MSQLIEVLMRPVAGDLIALSRDTCGEFVRRSRSGRVVSLRIGLTRGHLVSDPALVRHVLLDKIDNYDKHTPAFDVVRVVLGDGMLTSGGGFWRRQRRIAQPAFHGESVRHCARSCRDWRPNGPPSGNAPPRWARSSTPAPT